MYNRLYNFLEKKLICSTQFRSRQKHSTTHAFTYLRNKIRKETFKGDYACGIFVHFKKAIGYCRLLCMLLKILEYCTVRQ